MDTALQTIVLDGELDIARKAEVHAALSAGVTAPRVLVDFSGVTYADSTVISELLHFRAETERLRRRVAVLIGNAQFARLIGHAGLRDAFAIFSERDAAVAHLEACT